jgi:hypothetical protein
MLKPLDKPKSQPLVHHPSDVLDNFGHYDPTNRAWLTFNHDMTQQIRKLEANNQQYIRVRPNVTRRSVR